MTTQDILLLAACVVVPFAAGFFLSLLLNGYGRPRR